MEQMEPRLTGAETVGKYTEVADAQMWLEQYTGTLARLLAESAMVPRARLFNPDGTYTFKALFSLPPSAGVTTVSEGGELKGPQLSWVGSTANAGTDKRKASCSGAQQVVTISPLCSADKLPGIIMDAMLQVAYPRVPTNRVGEKETWGMDPQRKALQGPSGMSGTNKEGFRWYTGTPLDNMTKVAVSEAKICLTNGGEFPHLDMAVWRVAVPAKENPYRAVQCEGDAGRTTQTRHFTANTTAVKFFVGEDAVFAVKVDGEWKRGACPVCGSPLVVKAKK